MFKLLFVVQLSRLLCISSGYDRNCNSSWDTISIPIEISNATDEIKKPSDGLAAQLGQFPYHAMIVGTFEICGEIEYKYCNGAIISHIAILSVANCYMIAVPEYYTVFLAGIKRRHQGIKYKVAKIILHPHFYMGFDSIYVNDLAILKIDGRIQFGRYFRRVAIGYRFVNTTDVIVTGFGTWDEEPNDDDDLRYIYTKTIPMKECKSRYSPIEIDNKFICTRHQYHGSAPGDSGSPLVTTRGRLVGMISKILTTQAHPRLHIRLSEYLDWINMNLGKY